MSRLLCRACGGPKTGNHKNECLSCGSARTRDWRARNPEKVRAGIIRSQVGNVLQRFARATCDRVPRTGRGIKTECTGCGWLKTGTDRWRCIDCRRAAWWAKRTPEQLARVYEKIANALRQFHCGPLCTRCWDRNDNKHGTWCKKCQTHNGSAWQKKNAARVNANHRKRYATNITAREKMREAKKLWHKRHPEYAVQAVNRRRARLAGAVSTLTESEWETIKEVFGYRCAYCLRVCDKPEQDHVIAITRGGSHTADNVVPACKSCNARKGNRPVFMMAGRAFENASSL